MEQTLFAGSCSGLFYAFDRQTGEIRWSYDTSRDGRPANFHGDPLLTDDLIVVGSDVDRRGDPSDAELIGHVYAFEQATGALRWKHRAGRGVATDILRRGSSVYGVTVEGELLCLDLASGSKKWGVPPDFRVAEPFHHYSPVLVDGNVLFSAPDGKIRAVEAASGKTVWSRELDAPANTALVLVGDSAYVGTMGQRLYRLDPGTGEVTGEHQAERLPYGTPIPLEDSLLVLFDGDSLVRMKADLSRALWTQSTTEEWTSFRPLVLEDTVLVGSGEGELVAIRIDDGAVQWTRGLTGAIRGLGAADGVLYIGTLEGMLYAFRP